MSSLICFDNRELGYSVVVDEDRGAAYAYLRRGKSLVNHVWLYNIGSTPAIPQWTAASSLPCANPKGFARRRMVTPDKDIAEFNISWVQRQGALERVELFLKGNLHAILTLKLRPGRCRNAAKDGPLARTLRRRRRQTG